MDNSHQTAPGTIDFAAQFQALAEAREPSRTVMLSGQSVRLAAFSGTGGWHKHDTVPETVIVWSGTFDVEYRDSKVRLTAGQCTVIPPGLEHRGVSEPGANIILMQPASP